MLISLSLPVSALATLNNQLANHPSPYLALHGNDPVAWQDWSANVIKQAGQQNKLIFISSGYFSCHWCHVMQQESYSDKQIARQLHQLAIPVKIDRELQPALDSWLIDFTEKTAGQAGWPLNVFLTPDGYPLVGLTYLPRENFSQVLQQLQERWQQDEQELRQLALAAFDSMQPIQQTHSGKQPEPGMDKTLAGLLTTQAFEIADETAGGFGDQNKFPMSPQLLALLATQQQYPSEQLESFLILTLDQMANLGLRDHIGGGFFRYTVDPAWDTPHFEKMLYDNAQLAMVYLRAAEIFKRPQYQAIALDTLDFVLAEMKHPQGGYISSLSAVDDKNIEGGYYLWQNQELEALLTSDELNLVMQVWGAEGTPYLEAGHHLKYVQSINDIAQQGSRPVGDLEQILDQAKKKLHNARRSRVLPADNKVLAGWNGLMLTALSEAARLTGKTPYRQAANDLYQLLVSRFWNGKELYRFLHNNQPGGLVSLEDYAYVSQGIATWASAADDTGAWDHAREIAAGGLERFHNINGWQLSASLPIPYNARELVLADQTMPSPSATLLAVLNTIAAEQQDAALKQEVVRFVDIDLLDVVNAPLWYGTHISLVHQVLVR